MKLIVEHIATALHRKLKMGLYLCYCGKTKIIRNEAIKYNATKSCGCLQKQAAADLLIKMSTTHGRSRTKEYKTWVAMKSRCYDKNHMHYKRYGGRGITICNRWLNSFENFLKDMGTRPFPNAQIDRINNNDNYGPNNCRWVSSKQNANNKCSNRVITYNNKTHTAQEWSDMTGIKYTTLLRRLKHWGICSKTFRYKGKKVVRD